MTESHCTTSMMSTTGIIRFTFSSFIPGSFSLTLTHSLTLTGDLKFLAKFAVGSLSQRRRFFRLQIHRQRSDRFAPIRDSICLNHFAIHCNTTSSFVLVSNEPRNMSTLAELEPMADKLKYEHPLVDR